MTIDLNAVNFTQSDLNTLHDVIFNALGESNLTTRQILEYWEMLPDDIKIDAIQFGIADTPTRDNMFVWLRKNCQRRSVRSDMS